MARALTFLRRPASDRFENVALAVFAHQFERSEPYRRLCRRRGVTPETVGSWEHIPLVPTSAFKEAVLTTAPAVQTFLTSGTTEGEAKRGAHHLPELDLVDASWPEPFRRHVLPDRERMRILSLIPPREALPHSSLSYMVSGVVARFGAPGSRFFLGEGGLDRAGLEAALAGVAAAGEPVLILGTALAFAAAFEAWEGDGTRFRLPEGSRIMDTGGMKGRRKEVSRAALLDAYRERLGVPPSRVIAEYGMTELSSQFYETALGVARSGPEPQAPRLFEGPSWTRTRAVDPESLQLLGDGQGGLLAHWDLANAWTVAAVVTEDVGLTRDGGFELHGRAKGAELRGCSLATEEILDGA